MGSVNAIRRTTILEATARLGCDEPRFVAATVHADGENREGWENREIALPALYAASASDALFAGDERLTRESRPAPWSAYKASRARARVIARRVSQMQPLDAQRVTDNRAL